MAADQKPLLGDDTVLRKDIEPEDRRDARFVRGWFALLECHIQGLE